MQAECKACDIKLWLSLAVTHFVSACMGLEPRRGHRLAAIALSKKA